VGASTLGMIVAISSMMFLSGLMQGVPRTYAAPSAFITLPSTSDSQTCFTNINIALSNLAPLSSDTENQLLQVAEDSSQYQTLASTAATTISPVAGGPATEYQTAPDCAGMSIDAYSFSFVSGGKELSVAVSPSNDSVVGTLIVPAVQYGVYMNESSSTWGGGYDYWNGSTYTSPTHPYWYIEYDLTAPTISRSSSGCSSTCLYAIWSGLANTWDGDLDIAQTGLTGSVPSSGSTSYFMWYEFYGYGQPHNCATGALSPGDTILSATYSDAWSTSGGSTSTYNVDTYDSTSANGCSDYGFSWSSGLGSDSDFALLMGENNEGTLPSFTRTLLEGTIYDNVYNGGPSGHCTSTPYNNGDAISWYTTTSGGHSATESDDNGYCEFYDTYSS